MWQNIGMALGLQMGDLDTIHATYPCKPSDCLRSVLARWVRKGYCVERHGLPTWQKVVEAVARPAGGNDNTLAEGIAKSHQGKEKGGLSPPKLLYNLTLFTPTFPAIRYLILLRNITQCFGEMILLAIALIHDTSHAKGKASTSRQTNQPGLTLRPRIELVLCFDFVLLAPSLSTGPLSALSCNSSVPRWQSYYHARACAKRGNRFCPQVCQFVIKLLG